MKRQEKYNTQKKDNVLIIIKQLNADFTVKTLSKQLNLNNYNYAISTIYRIVDELLCDGVVIKNLDNSNEATYRYVMPCNNHKHLLLKCNNCLEVFHISCDIVNDLNDHIYKKHKFLMDTSKIFLPGLCENCIKKEGKI